MRRITQPPARCNKQAGFTLIELIAAIALIAIIYGFLPAIQRAREAANRQLAQAELKAVTLKVVQSFQANGKLPASLADLTGTADAKHGYRLTAVELTPQRLRLALEPIAGVTGSATGLLDASVGPAGLVTNVKWTPTPGADDGRRRMLADVAAAAMHGIGRMAGWAMQDFHFRALAALRSELDNPFRQQEVFAALRGTDGRVGFASIGAWANANQSPFRVAIQETWQDFHRTLRLGALGENVAALPGLGSLPAVQNGEKLLRPAVLTGLTSASVTDDSFRAKLLNFAKSADAAEARGDLAARNAALDGYIADVSAAETRIFSWGSPAALLNLDSLKCLAVALKE